MKGYLISGEKKRAWNPLAVFSYCHGESQRIFIACASSDSEKTLGLNLHKSSAGITKLSAFYALPFKIQVFFIWNLTGQFTLEPLWILVSNHCSDYKILAEMVWVCIAHKTWGMTICIGDFAKSKFYKLRQPRRKKRGKWKIISPHNGGL